MVQVEEFNKNITDFAVRVGLDLLYRECMLKFKGITSKIKNAEFEKIDREDIRVVKRFVNTWGRCRAKITDKFFKAIMRAIFVNQKYRTLLDAKIVEVSSQQNEISALFDEIQNKIDEKNPKSRFKHVALSKLLHALNPDVFIPWDNAIIDYYKGTDSEFMACLRSTGKYGKAYAYFLIKMYREIVVKIEANEIKQQIALSISDMPYTRLIDCHNWIIAWRSKNADRYNFEQKLIEGIYE